ncbi:MAG: adenylate/guanylate cyclase domain-containing protein, partial [Thermodesulfobacteriota bacterium]
HTGPVILGTIGSSERMDSTVLGLSVNVTKRIEEATRSLNVSFLTSEEVIKQLPESHPYRLRPLGEVWFKGCSKALRMFEVYDEDPPEVRRLKDYILPLLNEGFQLIEKNQLALALLKFQEAQSFFQKDPSLRFLVSSLSHILEKGEVKKSPVLIDFR